MLINVVRESILMLDNVSTKGGEMSTPNKNITERSKIVLCTKKTCFAGKERYVYGRKLC